MNERRREGEFWKEVTNAIGVRKKFGGVPRLKREKVIIRCGIRQASN